MSKVYELPNKITYNNYHVISVKTINKVVLIKTYHILSGEIYWFIGAEMTHDLYSNVKRILTEDIKYTNNYFKEIFKDDFLSPRTQKTAARKFEKVG